jgi:hypothetical protein
MKRTDVTTLGVTREHLRCGVQNLADAPGESLQSQ